METTGLSSTVCDKSNSSIQKPVTATSSARWALNRRSTRKNRVAYNRDFCWEQERTRPNNTLKIKY